MKIKIHNLKWFQNRIGKRIFRDYYKCYETCDKVFEEGLVINDKQHADYLYAIQNDYAAEGIYLNYIDKK